MWQAGEGKQERGKLMEGDKYTCADCVHLPDSVFESFCEADKLISQQLKHNKKCFSFELYKEGMPKKRSPAKEDQWHFDCMTQGIYRGKRLDNWEWVVGKDHSCYGTYFIECEDLFEHKAGSFAIDRNSFSPFTGKKIGGVRLFFGDIVETKGKMRLLYKLFDRRYLSYLDLETRLELKMEDELPSDMKIVGNKWDNPELLRVKPLHKSPKEKLLNEVIHRLYMNCVDTNTNTLLWEGVKEEFEKIKGGG